MSDTLTPKQMDAADALAEADTQAAIAAHFQRQHRASLDRIAAGNVVLVAHVTIADQTLTVAADKVNEALIALHGQPVAGTQCNVEIVFASMTQADFAALPEHQCPPGKFRESRRSRNSAPIHPCM